MSQGERCLIHKSFQKWRELSVKNAPLWPHCNQCDLTVHVPPGVHLKGEKAGQPKLAGRGRGRV